MRRGIATDKQYVCSLRYIDSPILRDSYTGGVLQTANRLYYLTDANHTATGVTNNACSVLLRLACADARPIA